MNVRQSARKAAAKQALGVRQVTSGRLSRNTRLSSQRHDRHDEQREADGAEGRSPPISAAKMLVAKGRMPSTTPPCEAGTVCIAIEERIGNPKTRRTHAANSPMTWNLGDGLPNMRSSIAAAVLAAVARPIVMNQG